MRFLGFVDDAGHFALDDKAGFLAYLSAKLKGHEIYLSVKKRDRSQGRQSMRYLRGVVIPDIAHACGYTDPDDYQDVFNGLAWKFLRLPDGPFGEPRRKHTRKSEMSQPEMTAFIDQLIVYAETTIPGCRVRRPDEVDEDNLLELWEGD